MRSQRQFTPGDWRVVATEPRWRYQIMSDTPENEESRYLADVGATMANDDEAADDPDADAQVMAASKALYLALSELVAACRPCEQHLNGTQVYRVEDVRDNGAVQQARAALALVEQHADG